MNETGKELVAKFYQALADMDVEAFLSLQQDDVAYNVHGNTPVSGHFAGKDFLQNVVAPQVFGNLQIDTFRFATKWKVMCADEQRVVAFMEADGYAVNGERYNQRYCHVFGFRDGKIAQVFEFFDSALAQRALFDNPLTKPETPPEQPFQF
jgi:ketosteroid isomerase-like protein